MSADASQGRLLGEFPDGSVTIETSGRTIKPGLAIPDAVANESIFRIDESGIHTAAVDPANVAMFDHQINAAAFDRYDCSEERAVGVALGRVFDTLGWATTDDRDDPVRLGITDSTTVVKIDRETESGKITSSSELVNPDAEKLRDKPDSLNLQLPVEATVGVESFFGAVRRLKETTSHITITHCDGDLVLRSEGDMTDSDVTIADAIDERGDEQVGYVYPAQFLSDFATAAREAELDDLTVRIGQEYPIEIEYERTDDGTVLYDGTWVCAPKIGDAL